MRNAARFVLLAVLGFVLLQGIGMAGPGELSAREYVLQNGAQDTGALNLVTAIYLGYRAFDTLGETVVLLLAVTGVAFFTGGGKAG